MKITLPNFSRTGLLYDIVLRNIINKEHKTITGAQIIYQKLLEHQVKNVFMYSGGSIMPLIDCFHNSPIKYFINTHEQNCGHAATGYAKSSNETGVVITTSGPGVTNLITPMLDAQNDSTPLVVLTGQVGRNVMGTDAFQEAPAVQVSKPVTKLSYCLESIEEIDEVMDKAFEIANEGKKGVVHIDIPKCISTREISYQDLELVLSDSFHSSRFDEKPNNYINKSNIDLISNIINQSQKPLFYIGQGASESSEYLYKCMKKNNIPVTSTIHGKGIIPESEELSLKWCGMHGMAAANYAIQESDCIIAIGSRFDDRTTGNVEHYAPEANKKKQIIHVDIEEKQFHKSVKSHHNLKMDSKQFLKELLPTLQENYRKLWFNRVQDLKEDHDFENRLPKDNSLNTPLVIKSIDSYLKNNNIIDYDITCGVGNHQMMTYQFVEGKYPKRIHSSGSLGVMGAGLPYAVGCQIANPSSLVIDIDGDSSFMMTMSDMKTIVENELPIKIAIMNDSRQMMVNIWERLYFGERYVATINEKNPDFVSLAESFGIKAFKCDNQTELESVTKDFLSYQGPALCEYVVGEEICLPLVGPGKALDEMILFNDYHFNDNQNDEKKIVFDKSNIPS